MADKDDVGADMERILADPQKRKVIEEFRRALAKMGAPAGGRARAKKLSKKVRSAIAKKAANSRWGNKPTADAAKSK